MSENTETPAAQEGAASTEAKGAKKKVKKSVSKGIVHIKASFNNTIVTITDMQGAVLCTASAGTIGYKGSRKSTPYAAQRAAEKAAEGASRHGLKEVEIRITGVGSGRESAVRALRNMGIEIKAIEDVTPVPHNGCRPRTRRRI